MVAAVMSAAVAAAAVAAAHYELWPGLGPNSEQWLAGHTTSLRIEDLDARRAQTPAGTQTQSRRILYSLTQLQEQSGPRRETRHPCITSVGEGSAHGVAASAARSPLAQARRDRRPSAQGLLIRQSPPL